jgi:hypothetical protein
VEKAKKNGKQIEGMTRTLLGVFVKIAARIHIVIKVISIVCEEE